MEELGHRAELDGLRGLAVLGVVLAHTHIGPFAAGGYVGVEVFFVLSGFLITTLLLEEADRSGTFSLRDFYERRARRLLPALGVLLAVLVIAAAWSRSAAELPGVLAGLTYSSNLWSAAGNDMGATNHLWSLAVEEQFYLLWPLAMLACRGRDARVMTIALLGILVSLAARFTIDDPVHLYYGTDARAAALFVGALAAVARRRGIRPRVFHVGVVVLISQGFTGSFAASDLHGAGLLTIDLATVAVLLGAPGTGWHLGLRSRPMVWLGSISYALYLWHAPLVQLIDHGVIALIASLLAAWCSTRWVEARFRSRRPPDRETAVRAGEHSSLPLFP